MPGLAAAKVLKFLTILFFAVAGGESASPVINPTVLLGSIACALIGLVGVYLTSRAAVIQARTLERSQHDAETSNEVTRQRQVHEEAISLMQAQLDHAAIEAQVKEDYDRELSAYNDKLLSVERERAHILGGEVTRLIARVVKLTTILEEKGMDVPPAADGEPFKLKDYKKLNEEIDAQVRDLRDHPPRLRRIPPLKLFPSSDNLK